MRPLSALDASFIYLESRHTPMHIGGVYLIDAAGAPDDYGYARFRAHIRQRLSCSTIFRQRLIEVPFSLSHPWWINDPEFQLDSHMPRHSLAQPGGMNELMELAGEVFSQTLDRNKPLWEIHFVSGLDSIEGLQAGSFAMITKVHHAAIDGGSGAELMGALLDTSPVPREIGGVDQWQPEEIPTTASMVKHAYSQLGRKSLELGKLAGEVAVGLTRAYGVQKVEKLEPPPRLLTAPRTPFNHAVTSNRSFHGIEFDFERVRVLRQHVPGATVNDVVLAICAGGLRKYLDDRAELPETPLVAMTPISVRSEAQKGEMGNQVSAMLVNLGTNIADPQERLLGIIRSTRGSKVRANALPANRITDLIPSETAALAARLYTRTRLGGRHRPLFNLIITNVPGPPISLYLAGARVSKHFGMAPVLDGMGLIMVIFSYAGKISIGLLSCREIMPNPELLGEDILQSLQQLESSVSQLEKVEPASRQSAKQSDRENGEPGSAGDTLQRFRLASLELEKAMEALNQLDSNDKKT